MKQSLFSSVICRVLLPAVLVAAFARTALADDVKVNCDIQAGPCIQKIVNRMSVQFDIKPKPVAAMSDLSYSISVTKGGKPVAGSVVALDLTMPGMYMGKNMPVLKRKGPGRFEGKGIIPKCPTGKKIWQAEVIVAHEGKNTKVAFVVEVK
jgi:hypothetical protein